MDEPRDGGDAPPDELVTRDWDTAARLAVLLETVQAIALLDFSKQAPVGERGDDLDALAAGINMLGEELEASQRGLEQRVAERTAELTAFARRLEAEILERRRAEHQLEVTNRRLVRSVEQLRWLDAQIGHLTAMSNRLQVVEDREEAFGVLGRFAPEIFAGTDGAAFVSTTDGGAFDLAASWGTPRPVPPTLSSDACWALRRRDLHRSSTADDPRCAHLPAGDVGQTLCVPVTAQDRTLGLLHLRWTEGPESGDGPPGGGHAASRSEYESEYERLAVAASEQFALALTNLELRAELRSRSIRDALTGLYNRRYLDEALARELGRATREQIAVSMLMVDIDHFKTFNDTYGHAAGDAILAEVADLLLGSIRQADIACRYGGEEFAVIMIGVEQSEAVRRAERIRSRIAARPLTWDGHPVGTLTVSVGVATFPRDADAPDGLFRAADAALYAAKHAGRDRVEVAARPVSPPDLTS